MGDLLKSQIHENCKLALPEGLKELMSDISREVLRAQPQNIYHFIANYLGALLQARETLTIACQVCSDIICKCTCASIKPELYNELRNIGLDEEDFESAIEVIVKHLEEDHEENESVKEQNLLLKLMRKINISETQLPAIQQAIQKAFERHCLSQGGLKSFKNENTKEAAHHTLQLYKQNKAVEQSETEDIFVSPGFKPHVTTVSSISLAGSYVHLPKFQPYCSHDNEIMSLIPEKEHNILSIEDTKVAKTVEIKPKKIKICDETIIHEEDYEKDEYNTIFDYDDQGNEYNTTASLKIVDYTETATSGGSKEKKIEISDEITTIEEIEETNEETGIPNDCSFKNEEDYNDEVQELIENYESENESSFSTIVDDIDD